MHIYDVDDGKEEKRTEKISKRRNQRQNLCRRHKELMDKRKENV